MNKDSFQDKIEMTLLRSEYKRTKIFVTALAMGFTIGFLFYLFFTEEVLNYLKNPSVYYLNVFCFILFIGYEIFMLLRLRFLLRKNRALPYWNKLVNIFIETLFPSFLIFIYVFVESDPNFLNLPFLLVYSILIIASTLHLDFRLSFLTGFISSLGYLFVIFYADVLIQSSDALNLPVIIYYIRSLLLLALGVVAGLVAKEIRKRSYNAIEEDYERSRVESLLGQQVSGLVSRALLKSAVEKPFNTQASIMFLDIRNFSYFVDTHTADEVIDYQNRFFGPVLQIINDKQGIVHQIMGDGLMASFGIFEDDDKHAQRALDTSNKIIEKIYDLNKKARIPYTRLGIGIHSGEIIVGNIGNDNRKQFSIVGKAVIVAARLEQLNKRFETTALASSEFVKLLDGNIEQFKVYQQVKLKDIDQMFDVYKLS